MSSPRRRLALIFLTIFIDLIGFGIVIPVLPRYAEYFGASETQNGLLVGVYSLASFLAAPLLGRLSDRVGRKPVLFFSILGTALGFFLMGAAWTLGTLFVARIIDGISGGNISTAQAYIADMTTRENRSRAMGLIGAAFGLGFIFGPAIGGVLSASYGHAAPMYFAGSLALVNAMLVLAILPESLPPERRGRKDRQSLREVLEHSNARAFAITLGAYFLQIAGFSMMTALFALFTWHRFGLDEKHTGYILALVGIIGAVIQGGLLRALLKRISEVPLASAGALVLCLGLFALPLSSTITALVVFSAIASIGHSFMMPTLTGLVSRSVNEQWQGRAMGILQSAGSLGRWLGPSFAGWLLTFDSDKLHYGRTPFWTGSALLFAAFMMTLVLAKASTATPIIAEPQRTI